MRILAGLLLLATAATGCTASPCDRLVDAVCAAQGEDAARCLAGRNGVDDRTRKGDLQCKRALFLYQAEGGGVK